MPAQDTSRKHLYLVDGSGYIFRAYFAIRASMTRSDGTPVTAVYGFTTMLWKLLEDLKEGERPSHMAVIFDAARRSFRNDIYEDYKAHRPDAPEDLIPQFPLIREATEAFRVPAIELEGYEADDIIATFTRHAREQGWRVTIVSSDKDLMQLVDDEVVELFDAMKNKRIGEAEVLEKFGVPPAKVIDVQALAGDSSDNVPGVPGIGVKTAAQLIQDYGDLDSLLAKTDEIKQPKRRENLVAHAEDARISRTLVTLKDDVELDWSLDDLAVREPDGEELLAFIDEQEFKSLRSRVLAELDMQDDGPDGAPDVHDFDDVAYETVTKEKDLEAWIARIREAGFVAVDTETTSLNAMRARLVGISLSIKPGEACYIPVRHRSEAGEELDFDPGEAPEQISPTRALELLKPVLEDPGILKIGQNLKYDWLILRNEGIRLAPFDDTMLMSYALECGLHGHGMDELSGLHLGHTPISFKEVAGSGKAQVSFDLVALDKATNYAAEDADVTLRLHQVLKPRLADEGMTTVYETLERPLVPILASMEREGIRADPDRLRMLSNDFAKGIARLESEIHDMAGREFNIGSPKQLGELLFGDMGLKGGRKAKSGAWSTDANVLEKLAAEGHDLPARVLDWRQLSKLRSTYTEALQKQINRETGRIHTSFSLAATSTGRLASSDPNLQNIPIRTEEGRKIREAFVAEEGHVLLSADYSQIELRVLAHMADIEPLREAFRDGKDIHAITASEVFGIPLEQIDAETRRRAKAINFGIIYGISAFGLANQIDVSRGQAKDYIDAYFEKFPGIRDYMDKTKTRARKHGAVMTLFGRRCHIQGLKDKNPSRRHFAERAAINAPIQGSAADIIRRAMIRMPAALEKAGLGDVKMLLQVHDELVFEAPEDTVEKAIPVITEVMEGATAPVLELAVPLTVECGTGHNWNEAH